MKRMIFAAAAAVALVMTGCEQSYQGPSADEIANATLSKENAQQIAGFHSSFVNTLGGYGDVTAGTKMTSWGQTDAAYTLKVNSVSGSSFINITLPSSYKWEAAAATDADITLTSVTPPQLSIKAGSNGKTAAFKFTYTVDESRTITGTLTVTTEYDLAKADVASLKSTFESSIGLNPGTSSYGITAAATKPIANWGQTDAAYTITSTNGSAYLNLYKTISSSKVEWKVGTGNADVSSYSPSSTSTYYSISNYTAAAKTASFNFKIVNNQDSTKIIQGTITVTVNYVAAPAADQEEQQLEQLKTAFANWPTGSSANYISTFWADTPISAWAQNNAKYTAEIKSSSYYSNTLYLPSLSYGSGSLTWSYSGAAVSGIDTSNISSGYITINSSVTSGSGITLNFTGTSNTTAASKTVSGTLVLTVK